MKIESTYFEAIGLVTSSLNGRLKISLNGSGCSACHGSLCMLGESKAKEFEIANRGDEFRVGEEVLIRVNPGSAYLGLVLLYLFPFLLLVGLLIGLLQAGYAESIAGIISFVSLVPYFLVLYGFRGQLATTCRVNVVKKV